MKSVRIRDIIWDSFGAFNKETRKQGNKETSSCALLCEGWAVVTWQLRACRVTESRQATASACRKGTPPRVAPGCSNLTELSWVNLTVDGQSTSSSWYRAPPLGPMTRFYPYPFFSDNYFFVLPVARPLWREDESVTYSAIADWSDHWGALTIHYRLIWDCVPSSSPLTTRRDYGGVILTRPHTGKSEIFLLYHI
jgi:hypothetical protein